MENKENFWVSSEESVEGETKALLNDFEVAIFRLDEDDLSLIKVLKNKLVRSQQYEYASILRDLEKKLISIIEYVKIKRDQDRKTKIEKEFQDSLDFGEYLVRNYKAVTWWTDTVTPHKQLFGYCSNDKDDQKSYTTIQVYQFYLLDKMKESLKK